MTKFFNKWLRKIHRWLAVPTAILIPIAVILKFAGNSSAQFPPQVEKIQSILMLLLAISGAYLYLIPYIVKGQRKRRTKSQEAAQQKIIEAKRNTNDQRN
jgi:hypothetical protein